MALRSALVPGLAILLAATVSGCAPAESGADRLPPNRSVFNDYPAMDGEFQAEEKRLELPPGVTWPAHAARWSERGTYGLGFGTSRADEFWYCAWAAEWLAQRDRSAGQAARAWSHLVRVKDTELYRVGYAPETRELTDTMLAKAQAGDPLPLAADVQQNC